MNKLLIYEYINRLERKDILNYCNKKNIFINNDDLEIIYSYIKNEYKKIMNNPLDVLNEIKHKINDNVFNEIKNLYDKYKHFI